MVHQKKKNWREEQKKRTCNFGLLLRNGYETRYCCSVPEYSRTKDSKPEIGQKFSSK